MRALSKIIHAHEHELHRHRLFSLLEQSASSEAVSLTARALAWWPLVFQDILRLTSEHTRGSDVGHLIQFGIEDSTGHDRWYIQDLHALGVSPPSLEEQFSHEFRPLRNLCYALMSEVYRPQSAAERVAFLSALEPTGRVFFERFSEAADRLCADRALMYFTRSHLVEESEHDLVAESTRADLQRIVLSAAERTQCEEMVARVYGEFARVFSHVAEQIESNARSDSDVRELEYVPDQPLPRRAISR
jgi:hypothetical protein